jgi:ubiquitin-conjugating enzyme E2 variant
MAQSTHTSQAPSPAIAEYSRGFRLIETAAIGVFVVLFVALTSRVVSATPLVSAAEVGVLAVLGVLAADLVSGLVHWGADTWGNQTWPIVGPTLIRSFREHHVDASAITRHDFVETNGATALVLLPLLAGVHAVTPFGTAAWTPVHSRAAVFTLSLAFFVFMTNQIHKWSHVDVAPAPVRLLQSAGLILTTEHHRGHHAGQHTRHYCITTGWMNPLLDRVDFFRRSERVVQAVTGLRPREDDLKLACSRRSNA